MDEKAFSEYMFRKLTAGLFSKEFNATNVTTTNTTQSTTLTWDAVEKAIDAVERATANPVVIAITLPEFDININFLGTVRQCFEWWENNKNGLEDRDVKIYLYDEDKDPYSPKNRMKQRLARDSEVFQDHAIRRLFRNFG